MTYNSDITNAVRKRHPMAQARVQEPVTISIRAKAGQRDLIDQAADRLGRSRSDFMLEAACMQFCVSWKPAARPTRMPRSLT